MSSWREEIFFSLCSEGSFIIGVRAGGMGRIYVLKSLSPPGAFGSAAGGWGEEAEGSGERAGNSPSRQGVGCFHGVQRALLFTGLCSPAGVSVGARFPKEVGVGNRLGSPDLICSAGGTGSLARAAQPCLHSSRPSSDKVE